MKNPFRAFLKASRMLSAALVLQRMALSPEPTPKRAKTRAKPPTSSTAFDVSQPDTTSAGDLCR